MSLDELELELRRLRGVLAVGFQESDGLLLVELQAGPDAYPELARDATLIANQGAVGPVAVEVVRWGDRANAPRETRLCLVEITNDPAVGELQVRLALGDDEVVGRASTDHGLLAPVEATLWDEADACAPAGRERFATHAFAPVDAALRRLGV